MPEVVAQPSALLALPERLPQYASILPSEEEVAPWIKRILEPSLDEYEFNGDLNTEIEYYIEVTDFNYAMHL